MNVQNTYSDNLAAYLEGSATPLVPDRNNATAQNRGVTLGAGTYYFVIDVADEEIVHITMRWAAAVAAAITIETTDYNAVLRDGSTLDVTDYQASGQDWDVEASGAGYATATGTGNSATGLAITAGGTNAGKARVNLTNLGARRIRVKVVASVGGLMRVACNGKREAV